MATFRIEKTKDYTVMSNYHLRDRELSLKATGLLSLILSLPETWDYTLAGLASICKDGLGSVRSGITELEERGYLTRKRVRETNGQLGDIEYTIFEHPVGNHMEVVGNTSPECNSPTSEKPICENPTLVTPMYDECTEINTYPSNTEETIIDLSNINLSIKNDDILKSRIDSMEIYRELIKRNIEYDDLCSKYKYNKDEINGIVELMLETICSTKKTIRIGGEDKPAEVVKSRIIKIDTQNIEYVLDSLNNNTTKVKNIKNYLLTTIYNSPITMDSYYAAKVNHDMYGNNEV